MEEVLYSIFLKKKKIFREIWMGSNIFQFQATEIFVLRKGKYLDTPSLPQKKNLPEK